MTRFGSRLFDQAFVRSGPIRWLVVGGTLLIAAIAVGATLMAENFRERALRNAGRELENTVLMLAHHFDQQLQDFAVIQKDFVGHVRTRVETREAPMDGTDADHPSNPVVPARNIPDIRKHKLRGLLL